MGYELLFLLLPVAALSGWYIGRRGRQRISGTGCPPISSDYFQGLNFLLNEQPDEALEVFIRMSEQDNETLEIQFALASLFLRRGEADRAIRIHQNLIARPMLSHAQRKRALHELGVDYMRAGLLDRAESLFLELADDSQYGSSARLQLLDIYQQEKEWDKAIAVARRLGGRGGGELSVAIAHFYCELAEEAMRDGDPARALRLLRSAQTADRGSVRATLLEGKIAEQSGQLKQALRTYRRVPQQDPDYLPLVIAPLQGIYQQLGNHAEYREYLQQLNAQRRNISPALALAEELRREGSVEQAVELLLGELQQRPSLRVLDALLKMQHSIGDQTVLPDAELIRKVTAETLAHKPLYQCSNCGFSARTLVWQCPSCKRWSTIRPIQSLEGE